MRSDLENELSLVVQAARSRCAHIGPMHSLWDVIFDAESLLAGKTTYLDYGPRDVAIRALIAKLS